MRRTLAIALLVTVLFCLIGTASAFADGWHSEQPVSPVAGVAEPLGPIGDIEFWAPNRGVLITAGVGGMPAGVYAYDGVEWHLYSTVCGGHQGRIAWVGPDEFWTISDQPVGQEQVESGESAPFQNRSLCHFKDGQVVASYAEPLGQETSYSRMNAVACAAPDDCWFGGERLPGTVNTGAFHLHWDGTALTPLPALTSPEPESGDPGRSVRELIFFQGRLYESVQVQVSDGEVPGESEQPSFLHVVEPGSADPFVQLFTKDPLEYGSGFQGSDLSAFRFASGGGELWALAGAAGAKAVKVTAIRLGAEGFEQVPLEENGTFSPGDKLGGIAREPGTGRLWVSFAHSGGEGAQPLPARIAAIHTDGSVDPPILLPAEGEGIGHKGSAGPIACPATEQCWMATSKGWLFHLGGSLPEDTDPAMHVLITSRPCDDSCPSVPPVELPIDDSGSEPETASPFEEIIREPLPHHRRQKKLVVGVNQTVVHKTILQVAFTLRARAHVRLVAERHKRVVAKTPLLTFGKGRHRLRLRLDPKQWPTHLDFQVHPAHGRASR